MSVGDSEVLGDQAVDSAHRLTSTSVHQHQPPEGKETTEGQGDNEHAGLSAPRSWFLTHLWGSVVGSAEAEAGRMFSRCD
jgi:hypothetical protein